MTPDLQDVLRRRAALVARSHELRLTMAQHALALERPLAWADRVRTLARWCAAHPFLCGGVVVLAIALRPRTALLWTARAWAGWRLWGRLQALLQPPWKPPARQVTTRVSR